MAPNTVKIIVFREGIGAQDKARRAVHLAWDVVPDGEARVHSRLGDNNVLGAAVNVYL